MPRSTQVESSGRRVDQNHQNRCFVESHAIDAARLRNSPGFTDCFDEDRSPLAAISATAANVVGQTRHRLDTQFKNDANCLILWRSLGEAKRDTISPSKISTNQLGCSVSA